MFGIGGTELALIVLVVLLLFGPDKIPDFARKAGRLYADFKRYTSTMESMIRLEISEGEKEADSDATASAAAVKEHARPVAAPATFEDDEDDEEDEE
ncbi:MAG: twin-arginine translocase subunit TatB [Actinobacteria bacterium]|nr:MAG: twin-arginine translocase subunit TatB [Actinomycetota bacterium]